MRIYIYKKCLCNSYIWFIFPLSWHIFNFTNDGHFAMTTMYVLGTSFQLFIFHVYSKSFKNDEAFQKWLKKGKPAWVPKPKLTAAEAIGLIHAACGLAVIAHPGLYHRDEVIGPLVEAGLDGIECFYTRHSTSMTEHYLMLAEKYNLLVTGGSDCHGQNKGRPLIGCVKLPYDYVAKMKSAIVA